MSSIRFSFDDSGIDVTKFGLVEDVGYDCYFYESEKFDKLFKYLISIDPKKIDITIINNHYSPSVVTYLKYNHKFNCIESVEIEGYYYDDPKDYENIFFKIDFMNLNLTYTNIVERYIKLNKIIYGIDFSFYELTEYYKTIELYNKNQIKELFEPTELF